MRMELDRESIIRIQELIERDRSTGRLSLKKYFAGHLFISHTGLDDPFIREQILPLLSKTCGDYFMLNATRFSKSSPYTDFLNAHAGYVQAVLDECKTVLAVISREAAKSSWVKWEIHKALVDQHPLVICKLDQTELEIHYAYLSNRGTAPIEFIDLSTFALWRGKRHLQRILNSPGFTVSPWHGNPIGTPDPEVLSLLGLWSATSEGWSFWENHVND